MDRLLGEAGAEHDVSAALLAIAFQRVLELLKEVPGISCTPPDGAFYTFVNVAGLLGKRTPNGTLITTDSDLVAYLLSETGVATVSGEAYGMSPYIRLSYASAQEVIEEGCRRFKEAAERLR